jgi:serine/threonine protein kinase
VCCQVAIKYVWKDKVPSWAELNGRPVPMEVWLMTQLRHVTGCVALLDWHERSDSFVLVLERPMPCRDLFDVITQRGTLPEHVARHFTRQLVATLRDVHAAGVLHGDVKDENVLVELPHGRVRLIDFGSGDLLDPDPAATYTHYDGMLLFIQVDIPEYKTKKFVACFNAMRCVVLGGCERRY